MIRRPDLAIPPGAVRRDSARVFISGHSLTDLPLPTYLAQLAASLGTPMQWNRQYIVGSTILERTRGLPGERAAGAWHGYRQGANREGQGMDVVAELRQPRTLGGERYDTLLITEQNGLLYSLFHNDTVRYLRHFHERFIAGNQQGQTYFYEPWNTINDKADPRRWIEHERAASPVWQCAATRINISLAAQGRSDRVASLPGGWAMAALVDRATQGAGVPGISGGAARETLDRIFSDDVHLTPLGSYYMAAVMYASIFGRSPLGGWAPADLSATQTRSLQQLAWDVIADYRSRQQPLDLVQCRAVLRHGFINQFWAYARDATLLPTNGLARGYWRWLRNTLIAHWLVRREDARNPLHYDAATDKDYWFPAP